ncbi:metalloregulator ArsR/SmtB family transcription factor [Acinetobacter baylyi]|uniref:metalloregulator ArsR/SmtB family transcription factor n=1 Tax=Acinetobacter baylyi TaxID=202950 RepID=UPI000EA387DC|nr:metalloregulator ArsR/SmtB family transcription factor [Acinetobacter baylyi]
MDQVNFFKCLSDETRLNIVTLIAENKELCVCDLTEKLKLSQPKISRHLALLRSSGLLQDRRQSQWVYYSINPHLPTWCFDVLSTLKKTLINQVDVDENTLSVNSYCE